jgi:hypothetical protein
MAGSRKTQKQQTPFLLSSFLSFFSSQQTQDAPIDLPIGTATSVTAANETHLRIFYDSL